MQQREPLTPDEQQGALVRKMRHLAKTSSPYHAAKLLEYADALEKAVEEIEQENGAIILVARWARARQYWCHLTGDRLI